VVDGTLPVGKRGISYCRTINILHGGHGMNVGELHLPYVRRSVRVHRSSRTAVTARR
jgi:hypothetical protein